MQELIKMLDNVAPGASKSAYFRTRAWKFARNWNEIARLQRRRPEVFESAAIALVKYIAKGAEDEKADNDEQRLSPPEGR